MSLPRAVSGEGVKKQLSAQFDPTQFGAIAVSHLNALPLFLSAGTSRATNKDSVWYLFVSTCMSDSSRSHTLAC